MPSAEVPVLRLSGTVLPEREHRDLYVVDGRLTLKPHPDAVDVTAGLGDRCWLVPGLVDAHCHIGLDQHGGVDRETQQRQARADLATGVTLVRDCGSPVDTHWIDERLDLPRVVRAGRHLARTRRYIRGYAHEVEPDELPTWAARQAEAGDGWVKVVADWIDRGVGDLAPCWTPASVRAAVNEAHTRGARLTTHVFGEDALADLLDAGVDCIEHGTGLSEALVDRMVASGTALVPTTINLDNFPTYAAAGEAKFPVYARHMRDLHQRRRATIGAAYEAGVAIYAGTDAGGVLPHGLIADEVAELATFGLSTFDALGAASWRAREWLGFDSRLVEGAAADVVVYDADPLSDLGVLRAPRRVVLRGRVSA